MYSIEWRINNAYSSLLVIAESGRTAGYEIVTAFSPATPDEIEEMLVPDALVLHNWSGNETPEEGVTAPEYGDLVVKLDEAGAVLAKSDRLFWALSRFFSDGECRELVQVVEAKPMAPYLATYQGLTA